MALAGFDEQVLDQSSNRASSPPIGHDKSVFSIYVQDPDDDDSYYHLESHGLQWVFESVIHHLSSKFSIPLESLWHSLEIRTIGNLWVRVGNPFIFENKSVLRIRMDIYDEDEDDEDREENPKQPVRDPHHLDYLCNDEEDPNSASFPRRSVRNESYRYSLHPSIMERIRQLGKIYWTGYIEQTTMRAANTTNPIEHNTIAKEARKYFRNHPQFMDAIRSEFSFCDQIILHNYILSLTRGVAWYLIPWNRQRKRAQAMMFRRKRKQNLIGHLQESNMPSRYHEFHDYQTHDDQIGTFFSFYGTDERHHDNQHTGNSLLGHSNVSAIANQDVRNYHTKDATHQESANEYRVVEYRYESYQNPVYAMQAGTLDNHVDGDMIDREIVGHDWMSPGV